MDPLEELVETLSQLAGKLKEEDAVQDPDIYEGLVQLVGLLEKPSLFPDDLVQQIQQIENPIERFKFAATSIGVLDPQFLMKLAADMRYAGFLT
jgi:hypothetical protein